MAIFWSRHVWSNGTSGLEEIPESKRREYILGKIESKSWSGQINMVVVSGLGLFLDSYSIFSLNLIIPILGIIYFEGNMPFKYQIALNLSTLAGASFGHIIFGYLGDRFGRRTTYGIPLSVIIMANFGLTMSSTGLYGSMSLIGWLLAWRTVLGVGIGGEMSLSAVICAEYAPTRLRGKMLTALSACQASGQVVACVVTLIVVASQQRGTLKESTTLNCHTDCKRALDSAWRVIAGVGVVPAALALPFRFTTLESPRFIVNSRRALLDIQRYWGEDVEREMEMEMEHQAQPSSNTSGTPNPRTTHDNSEVASMETPLARSVSVQSLDIEHEYPLSMSKAALQQYFWAEGNIRTIIGTSLTWACTDLPYYALLLNTGRVTAFIWERSASPQGSIPSHLIQLAWQSIIVAPIGAVIGNGITFYGVDSKGRRNTQMTGFVLAFLMSIIIGTSFKKFSTLSGLGTGVMTILYILGQAAFSFGPSTTTYILSAELYPTRYRCIGHGISGAFGKLGAITGLLIFGYMNQNHGSETRNADSWLPYSILVLSFPLLCGFVFTLLWIPGAEHNSKGEIKSLEDWGVGRAPSERTTRPEGRQRVRYR